MVHLIVFHEVIHQGLLYKNYDTLRFKRFPSQSVLNSVLLRKFKEKTPDTDLGSISILMTGILRLSSREYQLWMGKTAKQDDSDFAGACIATL